MRVLYASHTSVISGAEKTLLDLLRALPPHVEPFVACPDGELRHALGSLGIPCVRIIGTSGSLRLHPTQSSRAVAETTRSAAQLRAAAARLHIDLVHANSVRAGLIATATRGLGGPPLIVHLHDVLPDGRVGASIARLLAASARVVLANSGYTAADFSERSAGRGRVVVVDNPVDLERFDPARVDISTARAQLGLPQSGAMVGIVGQITPWKAQSDAIRAVAIARREHPELRLVVAGTAKFVDVSTRYDNRRYEQSLRALATELGVADAVHFIGEIDDVPALMAALELVLVPSWEEPFGRVVIEAMAMCTTVVATSVGGPAGIVTDGVDGVLLPPRSPERWGQRIAELLRHPERNLALGHAARVTVEGRYGLPAFTGLVVNSYALAAGDSLR